MDSAAIEQELTALAARPGVLGCALVQQDSGLVVHSAGPEQALGVWEAAVEFWRLHLRMREHLSGQGPLRAITLHHPDRLVVLLPCDVDAELLLVCVGARQGVDWNHWQLAVRAFALRLGAKR
jgi:hypothetical protein